jgi:hypothetical protein
MMVPFCFQRWLKRHYCTCQRRTAPVKDIVLLLLQRWLTMGLQQLLKMVLLLLPKITGKMVLQLIKINVAAFKDGAVTAAKDGSRWCCCC